MRKYAIAMAGILMVGLAGLAQGAFIEQSPVPWWTGPQGNPYSDSNGNQWGVYQVQGAEGTWSNWSAMSWDGSQWNGPNQGWGHPTYSPQYGLTGTGPGSSGAQRMPGLIFKPDMNGSYSWYGSISYSLDSCGQNGTFIFGKFDSSNTWTQLYSTSMASGTSLDLSTLSALQNIPLGVNDKLGFSVGGFYWWSYGLTNVGSAGIGLVPEPVTMMLLAGGLVGLLRRR